MMSALARLAHRVLVPRLACLLAGTVGIGLGLALLVRARLGVGPIDVLHLGAARALGTSVGGGIIAVQAVLLAMCVALGVRIGAGTVTGLLVPAIVVDLATAWLVPAVKAPVAQIGFLLIGAALMCAGAAVYLAAALGPMPRDGLMLALGAGRVRRTALGRIVLDLGCVGLGAALAGPAVLNDGTLGVGTVALTAATGPGIAWLLPRIQSRLATSSAA
ncbi:hypothetical protein [Amycolatopsis magusensis]|uniref:hypothetical protein n=1 Tax=Amycolatopsis magusensis TaxID=882444 RepID=UPI0037B75DCD